MTYQLHRDLAVLPASGAFAASHAYVRPRSGATRLGIIVQYKTDASATNGRPGFRVRLLVPGGPEGTMEVPATVRASSLTVTDDTATVKEYRGIVDCVDLLNAVDDKTIRSVEIEPEVVLMKIEPCELGDIVHPGELALWTTGEPV